MSWTFRCLKCKRVYTQSTSKPGCPKCKSTRGRWIPQGIAVRTVATNIDRNARNLAQQFSMSDFRAPYRGEAVKHTPSAARAVPFTPANGAYGGVALPVDQNGQMGTPNLPFNGATCAPTGVGMAFHPKAAVNRQQSAAARQRLNQMTQVVARHKE